MKFAAAVLGAVYLSQAAAAEEWTVAAPIQGADKAPTFVVTGPDPDKWPLDYPLAHVGMPCGAEAAPGKPEWRLVLGRKGVATRCEAKK